MQLKKKKKITSVLRTSMRNLSMKGCWNFFFLHRAKPIVGFRVIPQYACALSGTNNDLISRASSPKIRWGWGRGVDKVYLSSNPVPESKGWEYPWPSGFRKAANPELVVTVWKACRYVFHYCLTQSLLSQEGLTRRCCSAMLSRIYFLFAPAQQQMVRYLPWWLACRCWAVFLVRTNCMSVFLESWTTFKIVWNWKHTWTCPCNSMFIRGTCVQANLGR